MRTDPRGETTRSTFRDDLRAHRHIAHEYEAIKVLSAAKHPNEVADYNDGKAAWIRAIEPVASDFYRKRR
jgi:GrpB-like predicted nucleotidyltransferase (UPF0157 family)